MSDPDQTTRNHSLREDRFAVGGALAMSLAGTLEILGKEAIDLPLKISVFSFSTSIPLLSILFWVITVHPEREKSKDYIDHFYLESVHKLRFSVCHSRSPQSGIQCFQGVLDSCFRRNDEKIEFMDRHYLIALVAYIASFLGIGCIFWHFSLAAGVLFILSSILVLFGGAKYNLRLLKKK